MTICPLFRSSGQPKVDWETQTRMTVRIQPGIHNRSISGSGTCWSPLKLTEMASIEEHTQLLHVETGCDMKDMTSRVMATVTRHRPRNVSPGRVCLLRRALSSSLLGPIGERSAALKAPSLAASTEQSASHDRHSRRPPPLAISSATTSSLSLLARERGQVTTHLDSVLVTRVLLIGAVFHL